MKVALVYDRVNKWGGAERLLLTLHEIFPQAPLYTAVYSPNKAPWAKVFSKVIPSFLQKIPFMKTRHEALGTFTPIAFEQFGFTDYDLVISIASESAKGIIVRPPTKHVCIMLTPTRYLWSGYKEYFKNPLFRIISWPAILYLRYWDKIAAQRADKVIAISSGVKDRIKKYYGRESSVVHPPVELTKFNNQKVKPLKKNYYLVVSRLVEYKRVDLAIKTFNKLNLPLIVIGIGVQERALKLMAKSNITFLKNDLTEKDLARYYQSARALIMPQIEDFGLVSVEAQAAGTPVIAYNKGGARDTVIDGETGMFFKNQTVSSLTEAVQRFEKIKFDKKIIKKNSEKFSKERFKRKIKHIVNKII